MSKYFFSITILILLFLVSCGETEFNAGTEERFTALIDMTPESTQLKYDFISDQETSGCDDHEWMEVEQKEDGSSDNKYYVLTIYAKDFFKTKNNCSEFNDSETDQEYVDHELIIYAYTNELEDNMYIRSSDYVNNPLFSTSAIVVHYKLLRNENNKTNNGMGVEYFGRMAELEIRDLDLENKTVSGVFNATLYRGTQVDNPDDFVGVDNFVDLDLYNPLNNDNAVSNLADSIRIENCVFQRINIEYNIPN
tara:strand:- start:407 stop:1159 length:753 start_codon:yes stop_codon:yes gene_type:complete